MPREKPGASGLPPDKQPLPTGHQRGADAGPEPIFSNLPGNLSLCLP